MRFPLGLIPKIRNTVRLTAINSGTVSEDARQRHVRGIVHVNRRRLTGLYGFDEIMKHIEVDAAVSTVCGSFCEPVMGRLGRLPLGILFRQADVKPGGIHPVGFHVPLRTEDHVMVGAATPGVSERKQNFDGSTGRHLDESDPHISPRRWPVRRGERAALDAGDGCGTVFRNLENRPE